MLSVNLTYIHSIKCFCTSSSFKRSQLFVQAFFEKMIINVNRIFQIDRPDSSQNFMNMAKTIGLTRLCIQLNKTVAIFQSYTHQSYKEIQNKKNMSAVNRKYWVYIYNLQILIVNVLMIHIGIHNDLSIL